MSFLEKIFKLEENNTNIKTELLAGLTTFFTISYLFILSPKILETAGLDLQSTITVTGIVVFLCSLIMGLYANKPYAVAPFLGETAFISFTLVATLGFSVKTALAAIVVSGVLLLLLTLLNLRTYIVNKISETIKLAFCVGLGLFFMFIALKDMKIVSFTQNPIPIQAGNFLNTEVILSIFCFVLLIVLVKRQVKAAVLIAIIVTTILGVIIGDVQLPNIIISFPQSISSSLFQTDFLGVFDKNFLPMLFIIFLLVNIDTAGGLVGLSYKGGFVDKDGNIPDLKKSMIADSISVILAPLLGTTTPGACLDSMTGVSAGGRTGLTAITVGFLFLFGLLFTPIITIIPAYAYSPVLLYVGILMTTVISKLNFDDITEFAPAIFMIATMIFTYNLGIGIAIGFVLYPLIKLLSGKKKETNIISWIMFVLSLLFFAIYPY